MKILKLQKPAIFTLMIVAAFLVSFTLPNESLGESTHKNISGEELVEMMAGTNELVIVDVRKKSAFDKGHIPGAINIDYSDNGEERIIKELNKKDAIVLICYMGGTSERFSNILTRNGFNDVYNVKGGMGKWKGPVTTEK